jgi:hypothetical protein
LFAILDNKIIKCKCINNAYEIYKGEAPYLSILGYNTFRLETDCNLKNNGYPCFELGTYFEQSSLPYKYIAGSQFF